MYSLSSLPQLHAPIYDLRLVFEECFLTPCTPFFWSSGARSPSTTRRTSAKRRTACPRFDSCTRNYISTFQYFIFNARPFFFFFSPFFYSFCPALASTFFLSTHLHAFHFCSSSPQPPFSSCFLCAFPIIICLVVSTSTPQVSRNLDVMRMRKWWCRSRKNAKPNSELCVELQEVEDKALVMKLHRIHGERL